MSAQTETQPIVRSSVSDVDTNHITECHDENRALCGLDITDDPWVPNPPPGTECVVCLDLEPIHCGCGCGCCDGDNETEAGQ